MTDQQLYQEYYDVSQAGSFSGVNGFYRILKEKGIKTTRKAVKEWLMTQEVYTVHRPARKTYPRNKVISGGIDDVWQVDLVDLSKLSRLNNGNKYLITCIDVFSKYAWVQPIKKKSSDAVLEGFKKIINKGRIPLKLQTDQGTEFLNKKFKEYLANKDILLYNVNSELKASVVERFNRTFKEHFSFFQIYWKK